MEQRGPGSLGPTTAADEFGAAPQALDDSHAEWLETAEQTVASLRRLGITVKKVVVDLEPAEAWSREQGRTFDSAARAALSWPWRAAKVPGAP